MKKMDECPVGGMHEGRLRPYALQALIPMEPDGHGTLNYMLTWTSLDGRPCTEFHEFIEHALNRALVLRDLGRTAAVWVRAALPAGEET